jgi:hypothetical protein
MVGLLVIDGIQIMQNSIILRTTVVSSCFVLLFAAKQRQLNNAECKKCITGAPTLQPWLCSCAFSLLTTGSTRRSHVLLACGQRLGHHITAVVHDSAADSGHACVSTRCCCAVHENQHPERCVGLLQQQKQQWQQRQQGYKLLHSAAACHDHCLPAMHVAVFSPCSASCGTCSVNCNSQCTYCWHSKQCK